MKTILKTRFLILFNPRYKKIVLSVLTFALLFTAVLFYEFSSSRQMELQHTNTQVTNLSRVLEDHLAGTFRKIDLTLLEISKLVQQQNTSARLDEKELKNLLLIRLNQFPEASTFFVTDSNGYDLFRKKENKKLFLGEKEEFLYHKSGNRNNLHITRPRLGIYGDYEGLPVVAFSRSIINENNKFIGIVAALVPLSYFENLFSTLDVGNMGSITLIGDNNILYARIPKDHKYTGKKLPDTRTLDAIHNSTHQNFLGTIKSSVDKINRISSAQQIGNTKLHIVVGISEQQALYFWKTRSILYAFILFALWSGGTLVLTNFLMSQQELETRRKLDAHTSKLTSLGEMAAGIAHEINNPLAIISSMSNMLKRQIDRNQFNPETFKDSLIKIDRTAHRISKIIRSLKCLARNTENDVLIPVDLSLIVENAVELCREKFRNKLITFKIDPVPEFKIECREAEIVQVILNLLNNACDAVEVLEEKWVHLNFSLDPRGNLTMRVIDSGKGIPESVYQNLMHPFFTTKEVGKGTGLGLPISKGIVEGHGGKIYLQRDAPNTTFVVELPSHHSVLQGQAS